MTRMMAWSSSRLFLSILVGLFILFTLMFFYIQQSSDLSLKIISIDRTEENSTEIRASIESNKDLNNVLVEFLLPKTMSASQGNLQTSVNLKSNQPQQLTLLVNGVKEGKGVVKIIAKTSGAILPYRSEARVSTYVNSSLEIFMTEEEWVAQETARMHDPEWISRYYRICDVTCYVPDPLKGKAINQFFKSLNLSEDYIYVIMQFDVLGADPSPDQVNILKKDGIVVLDNAFGHTLYAKAPVKTLETKSYDFVRWMGIMSAEGKIYESLRQELNSTCENCTKDVDVSVSFHEDLTSEQLSVLKNSSSIRVTHNYGNSLDGIVAINNLTRISSFYFVKKIEPHLLPSADISLSLLMPSHLYSSLII